MYCLVGCPSNKAFTVTISIKNEELTTIIVNAVYQAQNAFNHMKQNIYPYPKHYFSFLILKVKSNIMFTCFRSRNYY